MSQLLRSIWPAGTQRLVETPDREFACAYTSVTQTQGRPPRMGAFAIAVGTSSFACVIGSAGDPELAPKLTTHLCTMLSDGLQKLGGTYAHCLGPLLMFANVFAKAFRIDMGLAADFPLGASMAAMSEHEGVTEVASIGSAGIFAKSWVDEHSLRLMSFYSTPKLRIGNIDNANAGIALQAPLGYLDYDKDDRDWADCREVSFRSPGDLAFSTFRFPHEQTALNQVGRGLAHSQDAMSSARLLTNTFAPPGHDAICAVACRKRG
jgi:hypothetical protein